MKYLCIKQGPWILVGLNWASSGPDPSYGETVTKISENDGFYIFKEYPNNLGGYHPKWFIPHSDIDETELIAEREAVGI